MSAERVVLVNAAQMRRMDQLTIEREKVPGLSLMEAAGAGTARGMLDIGLPDGPVVVLCGGGNNGGDGLVIARHLVKAGKPVTVLLLADPDALPADAARNFDRLPVTVSLIGVREETLTKAAEEIRRATVIVDALLGVGLDRDVTGLFAELIRLANESRALRIAVDIPSGLSADTGQVLGLALRADHTFTYGAFKIGQLIYPGASLCGRLSLIDIGIPRKVQDEVGAAAELLTEARARQLVCPREEDSHKGNYGHLLVLAGSPGMSGAAVLCTQAALRSGVGLVTAMTDDLTRSALISGTPEAMTVSCPPEKGSARGLAAIRQGKTALMAGPGWGKGADRLKQLEWLLGTPDNLSLPIVLDADALNLLAEAGLGLLDSRRKAGAVTILTPHPGEAARLLGTDSATVQANRPDSAQRLALASGAIVVLKGSRSIVAASEGALYLCPYGNPGMAVGGTGDVLAGLVAGILATGLEPLEAVLQAVCAHAVAGDLASQESGQRGLIAGDLTWTLGTVWAAWEAGRDALVLRDVH